MTPDAEWNQFTGEYVGFVRRAFVEGFRPRGCSANLVEAEALSGRRVVMIFRGSRNGWEIDLRDAAGVNSRKSVCRSANHVAMSANHLSSRTCAGTAR